ncbi:MAG: hypothetical protein ACKVY0_19890 [Prosthecobacter sp.]|uniref:hypothetical protein n=1 Tax=Prosthecobacter sp. TaxID=1965333 RepID=UPI0039021279
MPVEITTKLCPDGSKSRKKAVTFQTEVPDLGPVLIKSTRPGMIFRADVITFVLSLITS